jgi:peptide/nickel transport system permease protein
MLVISIWIAITLNFLLPRLMPGNPISTLIASARGALTPRALESIELAWGLSGGNLFTQYLEYIRQLLGGSLGVSIRFFPIPVNEVIAMYLPWTIFIVGIAIVISFSIGTFLGMVMAWKRNSLVDGVLTPLLLVIKAFPYFCTAILMTYLFSFKWRLLPPSHAYTIGIRPNFSFEFIVDVLYHAVGPISVIVLNSLGTWALGMRNNMIMSLQDDFMVMAKAKGLGERRIMTAYAARNAILPSVTGFAMSIGFIISGSLLTEMVFSYPGIGFLLYQAVIYLDYFMMQGIFLAVTMAVLIANFVVDLIYMKIDPRVGVDQ